MDSLTQIVLGAAAGEVVLGKKAGNRAMIWGAIGGTIPDLDVFVPGLTDIQELTVHRGFTHSFLFSLLAPLVFAYLLRLFYRHDLHKHRLFKIILKVLSTVLLGLLLFLFVQVFSICSAYVNWLALIICIGLFGLYFYRIWYKKSIDDNFEEVSFKDWYLLFFLAFVTHILLDTCTSYGTQLFLPFSNYRAAFNNISVADPFYTLPFLLFVVVASWFSRKNVWRTRFNYLAIVVSSLYMTYTFYNKSKITKEFQTELQARNINYQRSAVFPTILNNWLWHCVAEADEIFYQTSVSVFDDHKMNAFREISKNHEKIEHVIDNLDFQTLTWFSMIFIVSEKPWIVHCSTMILGLAHSMMNTTVQMISFLVLP